jgi:hypothetical protein
MDPTKQPETTLETTGFYALLSAKYFKAGIGRPHFLYWEVKVKG